MDPVTLVKPLSESIVVGRLTIDIACKHTKFDDLAIPNIAISWGVKF